MPVVVVGNEKGGCGKTTISVHLAAMAAEAGLDVLLVDADPGQQSAQKWSARRRDSHPEALPIRCVSLTGRGIGTEIEDLATRYGLIVVDTGAEDSPELRAGATVADVLVVPVQPEPLDLWTLPTMEALYSRAVALNDRLRAAIAVNRIPYQIAPQAHAETGAWIAENVPALSGCPTLPLIGRSAYGRAIAEGLAVNEMARRDVKAVTEMSRLYEEITR